MAERKALDNETQRLDDLEGDESNQVQWSRLATCSLCVYVCVCVCVCAGVCKYLFAHLALCLGLCLCLCPSTCSSLFLTHCCVGFVWIAAHCCCAPAFMQPLIAKLSHLLKLYDSLRQQEKDFKVTGAASKPPPLPPTHARTHPRTHTHTHTHTHIHTVAQTDWQCTTRVPPRVLAASTGHVQGRDGAVRGAHC